jgi:hypothetical protein
MSVSASVAEPSPPFFHPRSLVGVVPPIFGDAQPQILSNAGLSPMAAVMSIPYPIASETIAPSA